MWKALVFKELRDVLPIACIALLAYLACVASLMGYPVLFDLFSAEEIPFLGGALNEFFVYIAIAFTIGLGLWQTVAENNRGTWLFLLHRPVGLRTIVGFKLAAGAGVYLLVSALPILIYAFWAATPRTHASPFAWWMTKEAWHIWFFMLPCYFAAFLTGIRPSRWFGTRLLPLLAVGLLSTLIATLTWDYWFLNHVAVILLCGMFSYIIFYVAQTRDFS